MEPVRSQGQPQVLVLGLGNRLLGDDAAGPLAIDALAGSADAQRARLCDGGTLGLSLLPEIEDAAALIAVDAAAFGAAPGTVRVFQGEAMDVQLGGRKRSAHEVALFDLMATAALCGRLPQRRALVAVQPASTALGLALSNAVASAMPRLCEAVRELIARWTDKETERARIA
ncbi:MAG: hydrogenase maturation protease [Burkholderiaceae bacterium]